MVLKFFKEPDAEFATDLLFRSPAALTGLYQKLLQFVTLTFTPKDILEFLGRKWHRRFDGDVQTEVKTDRLLGTRIKHRMTHNWLKMYDKFGLILRVETVINCPREFSVFRTRYHRDGTTSQGHFPMNKHVGSLLHYQEQALACNRRYLDALAVVDDPAPAYQQLRQLTEAKVIAGRSYAGFNPARRDDVRLFAAVLEGDCMARGFRNKDIRAALFGADSKSAPPKRRGRSAHQATARPSTGGKDPAHKALARHRKWPPTTYLGRPALPSELARTPRRLTTQNFFASCRELER